MSCLIFKFCGNFYSSYVSSALSTTENDSVFILATKETYICMSNCILYLSSIYVLDRLDKSIPYHEYRYVQCLCYISQYVAIFFIHFCTIQEYVFVHFHHLFICTIDCYSLDESFCPKVPTGTSSSICMLSADGQFFCGYFIMSTE